MSTLNEIIDTLTSEYPCPKLSSKTETRKAKDGTDCKVKLHRKGKGKWLEPSEVLTLTINSDTARATKLADGPVSMRWIKAEAEKVPELLSLIGSASFKNASIRAILASIRLDKQLENLSKNFGHNFNAEDVEDVSNTISGNVMHGISCYQSRPEGMERARKKGEPKPGPSVTL